MAACCPPPGPVANTMRRFCATCRRVLIRAARMGSFTRLCTMGRRFLNRSCWSNARSSNRIRSGIVSSNGMQVPRLIRICRGARFDKGTSVMRDGKRWFWAAILVYAVVCKLLPYALAHSDPGILSPKSTWYPWNFAPMLAVSLFCGAGVKPARWAFLLPVAVMAIADIGIGLLTGHWTDWAFPRSEALTLGCFAFAVGLGRLLKDRPEWMTALPLGWLGEGVFFLVTNFAVWWLGDTYPPTMSGLMACYIAAIPFFGR